jgi:hypothetical protein
MPIWYNESLIKTLIKHAISLLPYLLLLLSEKEFSSHTIFTSYQKKLTKLKMNEFGTIILLYVARIFEEHGWISVILTLNFF